MSLLSLAPRASIPSPAEGSLHVGALVFNAYGLCIALGIGAAVWLANRRWRARGGQPDDVARVAYIAVPAGVVGARLYHVLTDWKTFQGHWFDVVKIWEGGLGIWGGVALGVAVGLWKARRLGLPLGVMLDVAAPALPVAQAIGRVGNWFNTELFGGPTRLPWALEVPVFKRPEGYRAFATFHPTFLYELLWDLAIAAFILGFGARLARRWRPGGLFAFYVALYTFGRFFIERIRIDHASRVLGLRINELVSVVVFAGAVAALVRLRRPAARGSGETGEVHTAA
jgi:prolipoprotein diacylglyceryl transferase